MFLTFSDMAYLFPDRKGIEITEMNFHTVSSLSDVPMFRGLYIPFEKSSGELKDAISNGAIAALWEKDKDIPGYTPNHFPIFLTEDLLKGIEDIMELYLEKRNQDHTTGGGVTKFLFSDELRLNDHDISYDIAIKAHKLNNIQRKSNEREGDEK
jgi:hypothetical protein